MERKMIVILNCILILVIFKIKVSCQNKEIQIVPIDKKDLKTKCTRNLLDSIDTFLFYTTANLSEQLEKNATITYEITDHGKDTQSYLTHVQIPPACIDKPIDEMIRCTEKDKDMFIITFTSTAYLHNSHARVRAVLKRTNGAEIGRDEIQLPGIYRITDAMAVMSINGKNITDFSRCHEDIGSDDLLLEFKCSSLASPCQIEIACNDSTYIKKGQDHVSFKISFSYSKTYLVTIKYAACRLDLDTLKLNCTIKSDHDPDDGLTLKIVLPITIILVIIAIGTLLYCSCRKRKETQKNIEQQKSTDAKDQLLSKKNKKSVRKNKNINICKNCIRGEDTEHIALEKCSTSNTISEIKDAIRANKEMRYIENLIDDEGRIKSKDEKGRTPLMYAAKIANEDVVKYLIDKKSNLEEKDNRGRTALIIAAQNKRKEVVKILVENQANVNEKNKFGWTSLMYASLGGQDDICKLLLKENTTVNDMNNGGKTCLMYASRNGHDTTVDLLLVNGAEVNAKDKRSKTPLMHAADNGHTETVKTLLERKADPFIKNEDDWTALTYAEQNGHSDTAEFLKKWTKINFKSPIINNDKKSRTELMTVIKQTSMPYIQSLIDRPGNIDSKDERGRTPLMYAAQYGNLEVLKYIIQKKSNLEEKDDTGKTALIIAAQYNRKEVVSYLVEKHARVNEKTNFGWTALMYASLGGHDDICKLLLKNKATVNAKNNGGKTCLMYASRQGKDNTVNILLDKGAEVNAKDERNKTPLMHAADNGKTTTVKILLARKANPHIRNQDDWTAQTYAEENGYCETAIFIKEWIKTNSGKYNKLK